MKEKILWLPSLRLESDLSFLNLFSRQKFVRKKFEVEKGVCSRAGVGRKVGFLLLHRLPGLVLVWSVLAGMLLVSSLVGLAHRQAQVADDGPDDVIHGGGELQAVVQGGDGLHVVEDEPQVAGDGPDDVVHGGGGLHVVVQAAGDDEGGGADLLGVLQGDGAGGDGVGGLLQAGVDRGADGRLTGEVAGLQVADGLLQVEDADQAVHEPRGEGG